MFPTSFREIKILLASLIILDFVVNPRLRFGIFDQGAFLFFAIYILFGFSFVVYGVPRADQGSLPYVIAAYLIGPIFWTLFLASYIANFGTKSLVHILLLGGVGAAGVVIVYFFLFEIVPMWVWEMLIDDPNVTLRDGVPATNLHVISTLIFVVPAFISIAFEKGALFSHTPRAWQTLFVGTILIIFTISVLVSGRTALIVIYAGAVCYLLSKLKLHTLLVLVTTAFIGFWLLPLFGLDVVAIGEFVVQKILAYGGDERQDQHDALLKGFTQSPFVGWGHGTFAEVIRNDAKPWQYELYYQAMLFHTGLLGFVMFLLFNIYCMWRTKLKLYNDIPSGVFFIVGSLCALLATYTNPYIEGIESMWMVTLPWAVAMIKKCQLNSCRGIQ